MQAIRCPVCDEPFNPVQSVALPFCSPRCRQIDLARWLDERYSMPIEREEDPDSGELQREDDGE